VPGRFLHPRLGLGVRCPRRPPCALRLDAHAAAWFDLVDGINTVVLSRKLEGKPIDFGALPCAYVPLDINTFAKQIAPSVARLFLMPEGQNIHRIVGRFVVVQGHIARIPEGNH